ncbi:MAG: permease [Planctomycetota bacterium]
MNFDFGTYLVTFMSIIFEAMPFIVIGAIVSGALEELLPQTFFQRWLPKNRFLAIVLSSFLGLALPMCECGIVPVMRRLLSKGVPASCAITYMLTAPVINPIVLASTGLAFWGTYNLWGVPGLGMVLMRGGMAFATAVTVGVVIERLARNNVPIIVEHVSRARLIESAESLRLLEEDRVMADADEHVHDEHCEHEHQDHAHGDHEHHDHSGCGHEHHNHAECGHEHAHDHAHESGPGVPRKRSLLDRLTAIADIALGDFLDIAAFLVIGAALAAAVNTTFSRDRLDDLAEYRVGSVAGMMALAFVLSLCSEADAFVAANFTSLGTGSKLAFLVLGPMLDIKLFIMYRWVFTKRAVWTIITVLVTVIFVLSTAVNLVSVKIRSSPQTKSALRTPATDQDQRGIAFDSPNLDKSPAKDLALEPKLGGSR